MKIEDAKPGMLLKLVKPHEAHGSFYEHEIHVGDVVYCYQTDSAYVTTERARHKKLYEPRGSSLVSPKCLEPLPDAEQTKPGDLARLIEDCGSVPAGTAVRIVEFSSLSYENEAPMWMVRDGDGKESTVPARNLEILFAPTDAEVDEVLTSIQKSLAHLSEEDI